MRTDEEDIAYLAEKKVPELIDELLRVMLMNEVRPLNPGKWILRYLKNKLHPSQGYVSPRLWVSVPEEPSYDGMYVVSAEVHGMPSWVCGSNVLYSTASGWWMLADDPAKIPYNKGAISSNISHNNLTFPHQVPCWDSVKKGVWAPTDLNITDTLLPDEPVSPRETLRTPTGSPFTDGQWPDSPRGTRPPGAGIGDIFMPRANTCKVVHRAFRVDYKAAHAGMQGWRCGMEDTFVQDDSGMLMVCDGHGGSDVAEALAAILPLEIAKHTPWPIEEAPLALLCHEVDNIILESSDPGGATACFALVAYDGLPSNTYTVQVGNVGDSRAVIYSRRLNRIIFFTIDHKPSEVHERARLEQAGLYTGERIDGLGVSRSFGDREEKALGVIATPDVTTVQCEEGDVLLIGCDGVFDRLSNEAAMAIVLRELSASADPATAAARLCDESLKQGSTDNISCIVTLLTRHALNEDFLPLVECIPGPYTAAWHRDFCEGYARAARETGTTVAHLLEQRYTDVGIQLANLPHNDSSMEGIALRDEFQLFHGDRLSVEALRVLTSTERTAWFEAWSQSAHVTQPPM